MIPKPGRSRRTVWGLAYRPELQGQGELYLYFDQRGKLTTALIQRQTYVAGELRTQDVFFGMR